MKIIDIVTKDTAVVKEVPKPSIAEATDVLVKVSFSALDTAFPEIAARTFVGSILKDVKSNPLVPGWHFSGVVEKAGTGISHVKVGDRVFGHLPYNSKNKQGSCAEYIVIPGQECAKVPDDVSMEVAAAASVEASTALQMIRDLGEFTNEKSSIFVIAAGGGVGVQAIQIAKRELCARVVHGVCSAKDIQKVKDVGADLVMDRNTMDITKGLKAGSYDVILELTGKYSFGSLKYALKPKGAVVTSVPNLTTMFFSWAIPCMNGGKKYQSLIVESKRTDLELIANALASGRIQSVPIDSVHRASDFMKAWDRLKHPEKNGRIVIQVDGGW